MLNSDVLSDFLDQLKGQRAHHRHQGQDSSIAQAYHRGAEWAFEQVIITLHNLDYITRLPPPDMTELPALFDLNRLTAHSVYYVSAVVAPTLVNGPPRPGPYLLSVTVDMCDGQKHIRQQIEGRNCWRFALGGQWTEWQKWSNTEGRYVYAD